MKLLPTCYKLVYTIFDDRGTLTSSLPWSPKYNLMDISALEVLDNHKLVLTSFGIQIMKNSICLSFIGVPNCLHIGKVFKCTSEQTIQRNSFIEKWKSLIQILDLIPTRNLLFKEQFNLIYRHIYDGLSINIPDFENYIGQMYHAELEIKGTTEQHFCFKHGFAPINREGGQLRTSHF